MDLVNDSDWTKVTNERRKRQRISTGGESSHNTNSVPKTSIQDYQNMSVDDKLLVMFTEISGIGSKMDECLSLRSKVESLERQVDDQHSRISFLEYKTLDMEARSRRNNLIFSGLEESRFEDCTLIISDFLKTSLKIDTCPTMPRVHRLGRFQREKSRSIIAYFLDYRDTELVMSNANKLKGSKISINRDFPKEIANARKSLWPELKRLRFEHPEIKSKIKFAYPAKIVQDGRVVADMFPDWNRVLSGDRVIYSNTACSSVDATQRDSVPPQHSETRPPLFSHVTQSTQQSTQQPNRSDPIHQPRNVSRSPRPNTRSRGRAPSRRRSASATRSRGYAESDPQFRRPWDSSAASYRGQRDTASRN